MIVYQQVSWLGNEPWYYYLDPQGLTIYMPKQIIFTQCSKWDFYKDHIQFLLRQALRLRMSFGEELAFR
jgi:hypothetical protein